MSAAAAPGPAASVPDLGREKDLKEKIVKEQLLRKMGKSEAKPPSGAAAGVVSSSTAAATGAAPSAPSSTSQPARVLSSRDRAGEENAALPTLPIHGVKRQLLKLIADHQIVVITGDTGSGKSTQLCQFLWEAGYNHPSSMQRPTGAAAVTPETDHKSDSKSSSAYAHASSSGSSRPAHKLIAVTQPRRIGAVSVATRVADELGVELGQEVGYTIRFEDNTTPHKTDIRFITDGCLLRECLIHKALEPYSVIVLDEAHERSLQTDILFGIVKQIAKVRPDIKIIITSATLDIEKFCSYFNNCPHMHVEGRTFPVEIIHSAVTEKYYVEKAIDEVLRIHTKEPLGHVLCFFTGQEQIDKACEVHISQRCPHPPH